MEEKGRGKDEQNRSDFQTIILRWSTSDSSRIGTTVQVSPLLPHASEPRKQTGSGYSQPQPSLFAPRILHIKHLPLPFAPTTSTPLPLPPLRHPRSPNHRNHLPHPPLQPASCPFILPVHLRPPLHEDRERGGRRRGNDGCLCEGFAFGERAEEGGLGARRLRAWRWRLCRVGADEFGDKFL
jgi:hypothetical protein